MPPAWANSVYELSWLLLLLATRSFHLWDYGFIALAYSTPRFPPSVIFPGIGGFGPCVLPLGRAWGRAGTDLSAAIVMWWGGALIN